MQQKGSTQGRKTRLLLYGGSGLVGSRIQEILTQKFDILAPSHGEVDVINKSQVEKNVEELHPDYIVYAAGLTKVDLAEQSPGQAFLLNAEAPRFVAEKARLLDIPVCYFSTDAVFDGTQKDRPYKENDKPGPVSIYGKSKLEGERAVLGASSKNVVLRIIMVYSSSFEKKMDFPRITLQALEKGEKFPAVVDQIVNPIFVDDVVRGLETVIMKHASHIYHLGSVDFLSNYDFARKLATLFGMDEDLVVPISFKDFLKGKIAPRAQYCWLDTGKFRREFREGILHTTDESLALFKKQIELA